MKNQQRVILVLGVPRSGTSVLTKGMETMGVSLGPEYGTQDSWKKQDLWEDPDFHTLNLTMVHFIKGHERDILSVTDKEVEILCKKGFLAQASELLLQKFPENMPLGIKDPRFSILLPFWKKVFLHARFHPSFVIALRNPLSFARAQTQHQEQSFSMWISYLLSCLEHSRDHERILVDYDELIKNSEHQMKRIAQALELTINPRYLESYCTEYVHPLGRRFHEPFGLVHHDDYCEQFAVNMYSQLLKVAQDNIGFQKLEVSLKKWTSQFRGIHSLLVLAEKNNGTIYQIKKTLQQVDASIHQAHKEMTQKSYLMASSCLKIHQRKLEITSLLCEQEERLRQLQNLQQSLEIQNRLIAS